MTYSTTVVTRKIFCFLFFAIALLSTTGTNAQTHTNVALNKTATASTNEDSTLNAAKAIDGSTDSRWASSWVDANWITIDLGTNHTISRVILRWEYAYASGYQIQTSTNGSTWTTIHSTTAGKGGVETITASGTGRYVRLNATKRATEWGYSLWEFEIYGAPATSSSSSISSSVASTSSSVITSSGNIARNKPTTASTSESSTRNAIRATDGNVGSRWASSKADNNWLAIDLGSSYAISRVKLTWEKAYAREYRIQVSSNGSSWSTIFSDNNGTGGIKDITLKGTGRYLRVLGIKRASSSWGYSLWEVEVYGSPSSATSSSTSSVSNSSGADTSAPTVPGGVKATVSDSRIEISWSPSIDNLSVTGYQVYRNGVKVAGVINGVTTYIDTNVVQGITYTYSVRARDAVPNWSAMSTAVSAQLPTASALTLMWSHPTARENGEYLELDEIGGYAIRYRKTTDTAYTTIVINNNHTNSYSLSPPSGSYVYEMATFDTNGSYSNYVSVLP